MAVESIDKTKYDRDQLEQIKLGLNAGLDVFTYANPQFMALQMEWIRKGLEKGIDVSVYANPDYDWFQMEEIYKGIISNVDISKYLDASMPYDRMREIREGLERGLDLSPFGMYGAEELRELRLGLEDNIHIVKYILAGYKAEQLEVIRVALSEGVDIEPYLSTEYRGIALNEILLGLKKHLNVKVYAKTYLSWQQMREIREGLEARLDISKYSNRLYSASQMHEIRLGLEAGLDVDSYRSLMFSTKDMRRKRLSLIEDLTSGTDIPMIPGKDGYHEYLFNANENGKICYLDEDVLDFENSYKHAMAKENMVIAIYHNATEGQNGVTAEGRIIRAPRGKEKKILSGRNVHYDDTRNAYVATQSGWIYLDEENNLLEIRHVETLDNISSSMGTIDIKGNLEVLGNITSGSVLKVDGELIVDGHVEDADIRCTGNIFIRGGINGNDRAKINTEKSLICNYIEKCEVKAKEEVRTDYILSSVVTACGEIKALGNRGSIIGSQITSQSGIECKKAGNAAKTLTSLSIIPENNDRMLQDLLALKEKVHEELQIFFNAREKFRRDYTPEERNNNSTFIKIEQAIYTKNLELKEIALKEKVIDQIKKGRNKVRARIKVKDVTFEGVQFMIEGRKLLMDRNRRNVIAEMVSDRLKVTDEKD